MKSRTDWALVALVLCAVLAVTGTVWMVSGNEAGLSRHAAARQAATTTLLTGMLDQETGLRGYIISGRTGFLQPYRSGRVVFARAVRTSLRLSAGDPAGRRALAQLVSRARAWQRLAASALATTRRDGPRATTIGSALVRKAAMDRFRQSQAAYASRVDRARTDELARAKTRAVAIILGLGLLFATAGVFIVRWVRRVRMVEERRYQQLVRSLPDVGILTYDPDLRFTSVDGCALDALGWTLDDTVGSHLSELVTAADLPLIEPRYRAALAGDTERFEFDSQATGQSWAIEISPLRRDDKSILGGIVMLRNISQRRVAERDAAQRTQDLETLGTVARELAHASDPLETQRALCVAAQDIAGALTAAVWLPDGHDNLECAVAVGMDPVALRIPIIDNPHGACHCLTEAQPLLITDAATSRHCNPELVKAAGCTSLYFAPILDNDSASGVLAISWSERVEALSPRLQVALDMLCHEGAIALDRVALVERLDDLARTDPLTGLANRRVWDERVASEMSRAQRDHRPLTVAILDLDHFKQFNDSSGHPAGDRLLRTLAASLTAQLRDTDTIARLGGEEFGVLLPGCGSAVARGLLARLRGAVPDDQTCSAGFAVWNTSENADELFKRADLALYEAKESGRDRACQAPLAPSPAS